MKQVGIHTGKVIYTLGVVLDERTQGVGMEQFVDQTILGTDLHNIERDGCRHAHHKSLLRHGYLSTYLINGGAWAENLDDGIVINTINGAHAANANDLTVINTHLTKRSINFHDLHKACRVKHVVDVGINIGKPEIFILFGQRK